MLVFALAAGLIWQLPKATISSDITALLPTDNESGKLARRLTSAQAGALQLLYRDPALTAALLEIDGVTEAPPATLSSLKQHFAPYAVRLLSDAQQTQLQNPDRALRAAIARYYSPSQLLLDVAADPFGYQAQFLQQLPQGFSRLEPGGSGLQTRDEPPLSYGRFNVSQTAIPAVEDALKQAYGEVIASGAPLHIHRATQQAMWESSVIGGGSLLSIVLLLLWLFGSLRPLFTTAIVITVGCAAGLLSSLLLFSELQVIGLVFAAGVIGLAVDYVFHAMLAGGRSKALQKNLLLACASSVLCYLCLLFQPIQLLQQVAVFASTGLLAALVAVLLLPVNHAPRAATGAMLKRLQGLRWLPARSVVALAVGAGVLMVVASFGYLHINNNLTALYAADADLQQNERQFAERSGQRVSSSTMLFSADSDEQVLQLQETFLAKHPDSALCAASFSPSMQRQQRNLELIAPLYTAARLGQFAAALGLDASWIVRQQQSFAAASQPASITLPADLRLLAPSPSGEQKVAPCLLFNGSQQQASEYSQAQPGVVAYDFVERSNTALNRLSRTAAIGLFAGALLVAVLLCLRLGWKRAIPMWCLPVAASLGAIMLAGLLQNGLNIFHVVALFLVFGIGIDYAVFAFARQAEGSHTPLAIACSGITSILAFGLLAVSSNPAVASFGAVVAFGITIAAVLALWVVRVVNQGD